MKNKIIKDIQGRFLDTIRKKNTSCWKEYTYNAKQKASDDNIRRTNRIKCGFKPRAENRQNA